MTVSLTKDKVMIVCDCHAYLLGSRKWQYRSSGYAGLTTYLPVKRRRAIFLHRLIIGAGKGQIVDHINRNRLDNRCSNLRIVTNQQNTLNSGKRKTNTSGYKGVTKHKRSGLWQAQAMLNGKKFYFGQFKTIQEAVMEYDKQIKKLHGDYVVLNKGALDG